MSRLQEIITSFEEISRHPEKTVREAIKETGKKAVGCFPIYTPEEIVYAAGMIPIGLWGGQTEIKLANKYLQSFCCSIIRANLELGMKGKYDFLTAVIIPTYCDTLKCICENWKTAVPNIELIPMVYPQNRRTYAGVQYMLDELQRVRRELGKIQGEEVSEEALAESFVVYEEYRKAMREFVQTVQKYPRTINATTRHLIIKAAYFTDKKRYTQMITDLIKELNLLPVDSYDGKKIVVTGIMTEPEILLDAFVQNKIAIAADDLAHESRQFRTHTRNEGAVMERIAYRVVDQKGCSLLYEEEKSRGQMLIDLVRESNADGIVISMLKFCDPEEFDYPIYKKELEDAGIPMLYLEIEQNMNSIEQVRTRIQSFSEILSK